MGLFDFLKSKKTKQPATDGVADVQLQSEMTLLRGY